MQRKWSGVIELYSTPTGTNVRLSNTIFSYHLSSHLPHHRTQQNEHILHTLLSNNISPPRLSTNLPTNRQLYLICHQPESVHLSTVFFFDILPLWVFCFTFHIQMFHIQCYSCSSDRLYSLNFLKSQYIIRTIRSILPGKAYTPFAFVNVDAWVALFT